MAKMIDVEPLIIAVESAYRLASSYGLEGTAEGLQIALKQIKLQPVWDLERLKEVLKDGSETD